MDDIWKDLKKKNSSCRMETGVRFVIHKTKIVFGYKVFNNITFRVVIFTSPKDIVTIEVTN